MSEASVLANPDVTSAAAGPGFNPDLILASERRTRKETTKPDSGVEPHEAATTHVQFPLTGPLPPQMKLPDHFPKIQQLIIGPAPHEHDSLDQMIAGADKTFHGEWFRITDPKSNEAIAAAKKTGSDVQVIEDKKDMANANSQKQLEILKRAGIEPTLSSDGFNITHSKAAVIDSKADGPRTLIGSMNLTHENARDIELVTNDPGITRSVEAVFQADLKNAANNGTETPTNLDPALVVSPTNAEDKIAGLIYSADPDKSKGWVIATSENWGDPVIQKALMDVAAKGVPVRVIGPECDENFNPVINYPHLKDLAAGGVESRMMPKPEKGDKEHPYMHLKMVEVMTPKGPVGYVGSINFSLQSAHQLGETTTKSIKPNRELGVLTDDESALTKIRQQFEADWGHSLDMPDSVPTVCRKPKD